ncbi:UDP pyrophosphate phosphatase [Lottiidibacillus patelloidae]|uniref:Undecaprenyl-diphosphatase n=1 Tax=Lottiidibacillus patelloidae TaxID=2670334 RepID=A0A263BWX4_9BACI|nr:undecaprenyl-diphosphate phosphatase [Lottiidibacillus patelloidae]OZM58243.1 UDP pyrophosphate phosphatase [Lottiidibacillus patelloidae]
MEYGEKLIILLKYCFLGLFQGFTEPIPISSSGHLVLAEHIFGLTIKGLSFEVLVNFGSLIAILIIYRKDLYRLIANGLSFISSRNEKAKADFMFIIYLIIGTIPAAVIGLLFGDAIGAYFKDVKVIGFALIVTGFALWFIRNLKGRKLDSELSVRDAFIVGFAQAIALIPGISRSGATIVAAMGLGMKQETALRFSFLLFIPVSVGTFLLEGTEIINDPMLDTLWLPYLLAFIGSIIASYYSLLWFMRVMAKGNLVYFSLYCFIAGTLTILFM